MKIIDIKKQKEFIQNFQKSNNHSKDNFAEVFTQIPLVEEMISKIPQEIFEDKTIKFFDPCAGIGNFPIVILEKLMQGLKSQIKDPIKRQEHILKNQLYFNEIQEENVKIIKSIFGTNINITQNDYLKLNEQDKYDCIVANPPYEKMIKDVKKSAKNDKLWDKFLDKSFKEVKENGYILYITPPAWMSPSSKTLKSIFLKYNVLHINLGDCDKWFNVGSKFSYYLVKKSKIDEKHKTTIKYLFKGGSKIKKSEGKSEFILKKSYSYIPQIPSKETFSILEKTAFKDNEKLKITYDSDLHKYTKKSLLNDEKTDEFKYKVYHTPSQMIYSNRKHKNHDRIKLFIPLTTYFENMFIEKNCGNTQGLGYILFDNMDIAKKYHKLLNTKLYRFIANITRWSNFNTPEVMKNLPTVNVDNLDINDINDNLVYKAFKLTKTEQDFIEKLIK